VSIAISLRSQQPYPRQEHLPTNEAMNAEIKRLDPDGVHDADQIIGEKVPSRRRLC
jgi:hypothetical protein